MCLCVCVCVCVSDIETLPLHPVCTYLFRTYCYGISANAVGCCCQLAAPKYAPPVRPHTQSRGPFSRSRPPCVITHTCCPAAHSFSLLLSYRTHAHTHFPLCYPTAHTRSYVGQAVPLLDAYFTLVVDPAAIPAGGGLTVPLLSLFTNDTALYPYAAGPTVRLLDFQTAAGSGGSTAAAAAAFVVAARPLALLSYLPNHDLFNTAVLDGNSVTSNIQVRTDGVIGV